MKIALIGLPQVGKKTVFSLLTGIAYDQLLARGGEYHVGAVKVADPRVDKLSAMYNPKKTKYAEIECTLAPAPPHEPKPREQWLNKLKDMDAFCHVVRAFEDPAVFHAKGSVDRPARHRRDEPRTDHQRSHPHRTPPQPHRPGPEAQVRTGTRRRSRVAGEVEATPRSRQAASRIPVARRRRETGAFTSVPHAQRPRHRAQLRRVQFPNPKLVEAAPGQTHRPAL